MSTPPGLLAAALVLLAERDAAAFCRTTTCDPNKPSERCQKNESACALAEVPEPRVAERPKQHAVGTFVECRVTMAASHFRLSPDDDGPARSGRQTIATIREGQAPGFPGGQGAIDVDESSDSAKDVTTSLCDEMFVP